MNEELVWDNELLEVLTGSTSDVKVVLTPKHTVEALKAQGWTPPPDVRVMHVDRIDEPDGSVTEFDSWPSVNKKLTEGEWLRYLGRLLLLPRVEADGGDTKGPLGLAAVSRGPRAEA